jgi:hypothetical protein
MKAISLPPVAGLLEHPVRLRPIANIPKAIKK